MEYKDYYKILGVPKTATEKEIKAAYRRLARKHHPDVNPGNKQAEARFKEINEANEVLSDTEKRRRYDELGANWASYQSGVPGGGRAWSGGAPWPGAGGGRVRVKVRNFGGQEFGGFSDFFRTFFGGQGAGVWEGDEVEEPFGARPSAGADVEREIELTLDEVVNGAKRTLRGGGRTVEVKIPPGLREGARVRVPGEGGLAGGKAGDLFLRMRIAPDSRFEVQGDDLVTRAKVPLSTAVLGGEVEVPSLNGRVSVKIPAGTPPERVLRLKGQGLPIQGKSDRGDLLVKVSVSVPTDLSRREKELFEELKRLGR